MQCEEFEYNIVSKDHQMKTHVEPFQEKRSMRSSLVLPLFMLASVIVTICGYHQNSDFERFLILILKQFSRNDIPLSQSLEFRCHYVIDKSIIDQFLGWIIARLRLRYPRGRNRMTP